MVVGDWIMIEEAPAECAVPPTPIDPGTGSQTGIEIPEILKDPVVIGVIGITAAALIGAVWFSSRDTKW